MRDQPIVILSDDDDNAEDDGIAFVKISCAASSSRHEPVLVPSDSDDDISISRLMKDAASGVVHIPEEPVEVLAIEAAASRKKRKSKTDEIDLDQEQRLKRLEVQKAAKALEKAAKKAEKEAEKSLQKKMAEVNKLRTSKNDAVREIELHLAADMSSPLSPIAAALPEIQARFKENLSAIHFMPPEESPVPGAIRIKRRVTARWDHATKRFMPLDNPHWEWDPTVIVVMDATQIVDMMFQGGDSLLRWARDIRLLLSCDDQLIIIIKDLGKYRAQSKTLANREYTALARAGLGGDSASSASTGSRISSDQIDIELLDLQLQERVFIVHVDRTEEMEDWVFNLCADIALRPYKLLSKSHLTFAAFEAKRKASSATDALEGMLQEVQGITPSAAAGIANEYETFALLMRAFEKAERRGTDHAESLLADCEIRNLKNGTASGRKLNKALAKRVYLLMRGEDSLALA